MPSSKVRSNSAASINGGAGLRCDSSCPSAYDIPTPRSRPGRTLSKPNSHWKECRDEFRQFCENMVTGTPQPQALTLMNDARDARALNHGLRKTESAAARVDF